MITNNQAIQELAQAGKRLDGRDFLEYRKPIAVEFSISDTAEGGARVQIGDTVVMAGVKLGLEKPYNDTPDEGGIMVNVEAPPMASPEFESGPPRIDAIELARVIDRGIREAKAIDMKKLCVKAGEEAWFVMVDIIIINHAGNLFDAAGMAALAALQATHFPAISADTRTVDYKKHTDEKLSLLKAPLPITVHKVHGKLLVDPTVQEEKAAEARLTVTADQNGVISALQKGGIASFTVEEISAIVNIALDKAAVLRKHMEVQ